MKFRVKITIEDYFDYVGTIVHKSIYERVLFSVPDEFRDKLYNLKYKEVAECPSWHRYYRVSFSVRAESAQKIEKILKSKENWGHAPKNWSVKPIKERKTK